jgi:hypothetical protein
MSIVSPVLAFAVIPAILFQLFDSFWVISENPWEGNFLLAIRHLIREL